MATKNVNTEAVQAEETEKKEAVNILDLLLGSDVGEIKLPTKLQLYTVIEVVVDATGAPMFKNKELMSKFKVSTPKDLVRAILLSGEIAKIYGEISELAGFGDNAVKEVKNS